MSQPRKYLLKILYKNGEVKRIQRKNKRRLSASIQAERDSETTKYFLRVVYSPIIDSDNQKISPTNEGEYKNKKDLFYALGCFTEE